MFDELVYLILKPKEIEDRDQLLYYYLRVRLGYDLFGDTSYVKGRLFDLMEYWLGVMNIGLNIFACKFV